MRNILFLLFLTIPLTFTHAQNFEGVIEMELTTPAQGTQPVKWFIKNNNIALITTTVSEHGTFVFRSVPIVKTNELLLHTSANDGDKVYRLPVSVIDPVAEYVNGQGTIMMGETGYVQGIGRTRQVILQASNGATTEVTVALDVNIDLAPFEKFFQADLGVYATVKAGLVGFPIEYTSRNAEGKEISKATTKQILKQAVADKEFQ